MITQMEIENFKCFKNLQTIQLRPLTLIYGKNSSGKSSIIDAINLRAGRIDSTEMNRYVYGQKIDELFCLGFTYDAIKTNEKNWYACTKKEHRSVVKLGDSLEDKTSHKDSDNDEDTHYNAGGKKCRLELKGEFFIEVSGGVGDTDDVIINDRHPIVTKILKNQKIHGEGECKKEIAEACNELRQCQMWCNPNGAIWTIENPGFVKGDEEYNLGDIAGEICHIVQVIYEATRDYWYVGNHLAYEPIRPVPPSGGYIPTSKNMDIYYGGMSHYELLKLFKQRELLEKVNGSLKTIGVNYNVTPMKIDIGENLKKEHGAEILDKKIDHSKDAIQWLTASDMINDWHNGQINKLALHDTKLGLDLNFEDVGSGVSQVLPLLIALADNKNKMITLRQPELHLHPAMQTDLADVFIDAALGENRNQLIIETHSEHLLLRVLRRVRETTEGKINNSCTAVKPEDVAVLYVQQTAEGSNVIQIPITPDGEFENKWPEGFFNERAQELF
ncbi:MAG: DUF3696 domain-containing protein [Deltaproteobacteria bacterium]|nr:DUF3696 domain-containing protein [Deltaproteobacteria bacterium]